MIIKQFEDKALSHYAYAILSEESKEIALVDPARDIRPYLKFAEENNAKITAVIETHPHADFVSSHLELHEKTGATIYCSAKIKAAYPHNTFDDGDSFSFGEVKLLSLNTPGHSPDSISIVAEEKGKMKAVFTGDTLFIGDCGRPDLRENVGNMTAKREELAAQMYHSLRDKLMPLPNEVIVYPAHGAGSLCGKALSEANHSTIGAEKISNWSMQEMTEEDFVKELTADQPFIPKYFGYDVDLNKNGAPGMHDTLLKVHYGHPVMNEADAERLDNEIVLIDTRPEQKFKAGHLPNSINLMDGGKFETWLGSIVAPNEPYYLAADNEEVLRELVNRTAKIGYEMFMKEAFVLKHGDATSPAADVEGFKNNKDAYTIVDIRNTGEVKQQPIFENAIAIPLHELRERADEIPADKPIMVHCAGGYRSAAGASILENKNTQVYDLSEAIKLFS